MKISQIFPRLKTLNSFYIPPIEVTIDRATQWRLWRKYGMILSRLKMAKRNYLKMRNELRAAINPNTVEQ